VSTSVEVSSKILGTDLSVMAVVYIRLKVPGPGHVTCPLPYDSITTTSDMLRSYITEQSIPDDIQTQTHRS